MDDEWVTKWGGKYIRLDGEQRDPRAARVAARACAGVVPAHAEIERPDERRAVLHVRCSILYVTS